MAWQGRPIVENDIAFRIEGECRQPPRRKYARRPQGLQLSLGLLDVEFGRPPAKQAERDGAIGGVALPGKGKGTVKADADRKRLFSRRAHSQ